MHDLERQEIRNNKAIRGYIIRSLVKGHNNSLLVRQVSNLLINSGMVHTPDIGKHLDYLVQAGYVKFTDEKIKSFSAYRDDVIIKLTKKGVDLVEGTTEDPGVDI